MVVEDLPVDLDAISHCAEDVDDRPSNGALPAPGFANEAQCFAFMKIEAHVIDCAHFRDLAGEDTTDDGESDTEILDFQELSVGLRFRCIQHFHLQRTVGAVYDRAFFLERTKYARS